MESAFEVGSIILDNGDNELPEVGSAEWLMAFEDGELSDEQVIEGFQAMINTGLVWRLQGSYGRMADALIKAGHCHAIH